MTSADSTARLLRIGLSCEGCGAGLPIRVGAQVAQHAPSVDALLLTYRCKRCKTLVSVRFRDLDLASPSTVGLQNTGR